MTRPQHTERIAFIAVIAWMSVCLLFAGMFPRLHQAWSVTWITTGLLGLVSAVGLAETLKLQSVRQASTIDELKSQANTDGLTGLANRRGFDLVISSLIKSGSTFTLILLDVDRFKQYNDAFGHPAGDQMLRQLASIMSAAVEQNEVIARYGGEEFAVLVKETDATEAQEIAERLRRQIEQVTECLDPNGGVTVSLGIAWADGEDTKPEVVISQADTALYRAKDAGRNRICFHQDTELEDSCEPELVSC